MEKQHHLYIYDKSFYYCISIHSKRTKKKETPYFHHSWSYRRWTVIYLFCVCWYICVKYCFVFGFTYCVIIVSYFCYYIFFSLCGRVHLVLSCKHSDVIMWHLHHCWPLPYRRWLVLYPELTTWVCRPCGVPVGAAVVCSRSPIRATLRVLIISGETAQCAPNIQTDWSGALPYCMSALFLCIFVFVLIYFLYYYCVSCHIVLINFVL